MKLHMKLDDEFSPFFLKQVCKLWIFSDFFFVSEKELGPGLFNGLCSPKGTTPSPPPLPPKVASPKEHCRAMLKNPVLRFFFSEKNVRWYILVNIFLYFHVNNSSTLKVSVKTLQFEMFFFFVACIIFFFYDGFSHGFLTMSCCLAVRSNRLISRSPRRL